MIIQTKNNISQHCPPPSTTSAPEVSLSTTSTTGPRQQQSQLAQTGPPHYVDLHVNAGECVSLQLLDGQEQVVAGPATITMISQQPNPPVPIPVQVSIGALHNNRFIAPVGFNELRHDYDNLGANQCRIKSSLLK